MIKEVNAGANGAGGSLDYGKVDKYRYFLPVLEIYKYVPILGTYRLYLLSEGHRQKDIAGILGSALRDRAGVEGLARRSGKSSMANSE